jgi:hypothetical protein
MYMSDMGQSLQDSITDQEHLLKTNFLCVNERSVSESVLKMFFIVSMHLSDCVPRCEYLPFPRWECKLWMVLDSFCKNAKTFGVCVSLPALGQGELKSVDMFLTSPFGDEGSLLCWNLIVLYFGACIRVGLSKQPWFDEHEAEQVLQKQVCGKEGRW